MANEYLCELFDQETEDGNRLDQFSDLLYSAIAKIKEKFEAKVSSGLFTNRNLVIPNKENQINDVNDFELITWLVIV